MQPAYKVDQIGVGQIDQSYLLVNRIATALTIDAWRASCMATLTWRDRELDSEDITVATNPLGYVKGVSISTVRRNLAFGQSLEVSLLAVASAADEVGVGIALIEHLSKLAKAECCKAIRIWTSAESDWTRCVDTLELDRSSHATLVIFNQSDVPI